MKRAAATGSCCAFADGVGALESTEDRDNAATAEDEDDADTCKFPAILRIPESGGKSLFCGIKSKGENIASLTHMRGERR